MKIVIQKPRNKTSFYTKITNKQLTGLSKHLISPMILNKVARTKRLFQTLIALQFCQYSYVSKSQCTSYTKIARSEWDKYCIDPLAQVTCPAIIVSWNESFGQIYATKMRQEQLQLEISLLFSMIVMLINAIKY